MKKLKKVSHKILINIKNINWNDNLEVIVPIFKITFQFFLIFKFIK